MNAGPASRALPVFVALLVALFVAVLGGSITELGPWYQELETPAWKPPDWLFGPAWTIIFALTALSAATAWRQAPNRSSREWLIALFALNGFLNVLWSLLFFRLRRPDWALFEVIFLWLSILVLIVILAGYSRDASRLLYAYLVWVSFAALLNWSVVQLNPSF